MLLPGQKSRATECGWSHCHPVCSPPWCSQAICIALGKTRASRARVALKCTACCKEMDDDRYDTHTHTTSYISYYTMLHHTTAHTVDTYVYYIYRYRYYIPVSQTNLPHEPAAGVWTDQTIAGTNGKESSWGVVATSLAGPSRPWSWTFYRGNDHRRWREREREKDKERQRMLWLYAKVFQAEAAMQHCTEIETAMNYHLHPSTSIYMYFICTYFTSISHPFQSSILISIYSNFTSICIHL